MPEQTLPSSIEKRGQPFRPRQGSGALAFFLTVWILVAMAAALGDQDSPIKKAFPEPKIPFAPPHYLCYRTASPMSIDGRLDEPAWKKAPWTEDFVDIEGSQKPKPRLRTRAKMLWDEDYFYIGAELEEPDIWATLRERDSIIYLANDFEVFIDPDGDAHLYYELEVNALATEWDLFLVKPYRDGGPAIHSWDIQGLKTAVFLEGTINQPGDRDRGWSVEMAMPWAVLKESAPAKKPPAAGDQWRVNFSRVEYQVEVRDGKYEKVRDPQTGKPYPEDNWVWAPTGLINIHYPEMWGYVQFSNLKVGEGSERFKIRAEEEQARWALRQLYYKEKTYFLNHGHYTDNLAELGLGEIKVKGYRWPPRIRLTWNAWEAMLESEEGTGNRRVFITHDGRVF